MRKKLEESIVTIYIIEENSTSIYITDWLKFLELLPYDKPDIQSLIL